MAWCGYGFLLLGRHEKARDVVLEAMCLDPLHSPALDWTLGQIYFFAGQYGDVIKVLIGEALNNTGNTWHKACVWPDCRNKFKEKFCSAWALPR